MYPLIIKPLGQQRKVSNYLYTHTLEHKHKPHTPKSQQELCTLKRKGIVLCNTKSVMRESLVLRFDRYTIGDTDYESWKRKYIR